MKTKQLVCNDCGCRFEIRDVKESGRESIKAKRAEESKSAPLSLSCPECRSYNITTA